MLSATFKSNLNFPKINFQEDLRFIAEHIIIKGIQRNIESGVSLNETPLPALEPATLKRKARLGQSLKTLVATGTLRTSFFKMDKGKNAVVISIRPVRYNIGGYLQIEGIKTRLGRKYFNFFGISTTMENAAVTYMRAKLQKLLKNGQ